MAKSTFTTIVIVALLLLNFGTLAFLWFHNGPPRHDERGPRGGGPADFIIRELKLNAEQQEKFKKLRDEHHNRVEDLRDSIRDLRTKLYAQLKEEGAEKAESTGMAKEIGDKEAEIQLVTLRHFRDLRAILTTEQKESFNRIIDEVTRMISGPQGPPPPHDRGGPPR
jgi:Spy/CpxP family protein refolding chaperone